MKHFFPYTLLLLFFLLTPSYAQDKGYKGSGILKGSTYYAIYDDNEYSSSTAGEHSTIHSYSYSVPGNQLSFQAKKNMLTAVNGTVYINADGSENQDYGSISVGKLSKSYKDFGSYAIPRDKRTLYIRRTHGSYTRYIRNVHLTMASYLDEPSVSSVTFQPRELNSDNNVTAFTFDWCNIGTVSVTYSGSSAFSVTTTSFSTTGEYGTATIHVTYQHQEIGNQTGIVTITAGTTKRTVNLSGYTTPMSQSIVWNQPLTDITTDDNIQCNAYATSGLPITYSSSDTNIATVDADGYLTILSTGSVTLTANQAGSDTYAAADPVTCTFRISYPQQPYLCLLPQNGTIGGDVHISVSDTLYQNIIYYAATSPANLVGNLPVSIQQAQYILLPVYADQWTTFVPPFDIASVYVIEMLPETELQNLSRTQAVQRQQQQALALADSINRVCSTAAAASQSLPDIIAAILQSWTKQNNYTSDALGIYPLTHYNGNNLFSADYYAYSTSDSWDLSSETTSGLQKQWQPLTDNETTLFQQGRVYALQFPYCTGCAVSDNYDYWSGKLLLLSHTGTQTVYGEEQHSNILSDEPDENKALLTGNYTLHTMQADDVYLHETDPNSQYYDCFLFHEQAQVLPTQALLRANIPAAPQHAPVAIRRSGQLLYPDTNGADISTAHRNSSADNSLSWHTADESLTLLSTVNQQVRIYSVSGILVRTVHLTPNNETTLHLPPSTYILQPQSSPSTVIVL